VFLPILLAGLVSQAGGTTAPAAPVPAQHLAIVEGAKGAYEECRAKVDKEHPRKPSKLKNEKDSKQKSIKDLQKDLEIAMKEGEEMSKRLQALTKCDDAFASVVRGKFSEAGASAAEATAALDAWYKAREAKTEASPK
jgi:3-hydroxyisobutyrate dehydrogenase-like beta-hydroxyacid dehydrogenase